LPIQIYGGAAMSNRFDSIVRLSVTLSKIGQLWALLGLLALLGVRSSAQTSLEDVHVSPHIRPMVADARYGTTDASHLIKKNVDLVLVPVTVTDPMQRLVTGLNKDNFQVFENKTPQEIRHFSSEDAPVSLGIIVDISGSMSAKMDRVREAIKEFCAFSNPQDEFFVITFSNQPHLVHDFADSPENIAGEMLQVMPRGRTALLDAIYMGMQKMREARYGKKALLIISDGGDNHSRYSERELVSAVKESDVMIYAIGIFDRYVPTQEERLGPALLSQITEVTGGSAFILENLVEMPALARRIGIELRTQYVLGYSPQNAPQDGKWHKISVKLRIPKKLRFLQAKAKAKTGYYASR
jgi:Ca-activated chloride channel homolog